MDKGQGTEKLFSENLDRLLAGEETRIGEVDDDLRSALDFAGRIIDLRVSPSPIFEADLKSSLMQKLSALESQKEVSSPGWFWKIIPRSSIWQAVATAFVVLLFAGILWISGIFDNYQTPIVRPPTTTTTVITTKTTTATSTTTAATTTTSAATTTTTKTVSSTTTATSTSPALLVRAEASTDKITYLPGEPVKIDVTLQNLGTETLQLSKFPPILSLMKVATKQPVYTFPYGNQVTSLAPNSISQYTVTWNQQDTSGLMVPGGSYYAELEDLDYQGRTIKLTLSQPVQFNIAD